jgi:hypothetical protein
MASQPPKPPLPEPDPDPSPDDAPDTLADADQVARESGDPDSLGDGDAGIE